MELICYLSNGYPTIEDSVAMAETYAQAGCDIIEIDFPSRDPYLESEYISGRMKIAMEHNANYDDYMAGMIKTKKRLPETKFILMVYENTVQDIGYEKFVRFCRENDFRDLILVGINDERIKNKLMSDSIRVSCYVQFHMDESEIESARNSNGFVYLQAKPATNDINPDYPNLADCIKYLREQGITRPIYCGVGVHTPEDAKMAKESGADGVFVGSTILKLHNDKMALAEKIKEFKAQC